MTWASRAQQRKAETGPGQRSPGKYNSPKFLRNGVGEGHQSLLPPLKSRPDGFDVKRVRPIYRSTLISHLSSRTYPDDFIVLLLYGI